MNKLYIFIIIYISKVYTFKLYKFTDRIIVK